MARVTDEVPNHRSILLLDPRLVVLSIGAGPCEDHFLLIAKGHNCGNSSFLAKVSSKSMTDEVAKVSTFTPEQQKKLVDDAIERLDRLAESDLEMARLFLSRGKIEIAGRRLQEVIDRYEKSDLASEARNLLNQLRAAQEADSA